MTDPINGLPALATHLRDKLDPNRPKPKKFILLFAYNGTGKTRLSGAFRDIGKKVDEDGQTSARNTLYFNAFTEDLFTWDNDLAQDTDRVLKFNSDSSFFNGIRELDMDTRIGPLLERYTDLQFYIDYEGRKSTVTDADGKELEVSEGPHILFFRERNTDGEPIPLKPSRGEENIFVWCFFLAIVQLVLDGAEAYDWVKYTYIDDPALVARRAQRDRRRQSPRAAVSRSGRSGRRNGHLDAPPTVLQRLALRTEELLRPSTPIRADP